MSASMPQYATIRFRNDSGEEIPAWACMQAVLGVIVDDDTPVVPVIQPDGDGEIFYLNGRSKVAAGAYGYANVQYPQWGLSSSTTFEEEIGPVSGSWEMTNAGSGFRVVGPEIPDGGPVLVERVAAAAGGEECHFVITAFTCDPDCVTQFATATVETIACSGATVAVSDTITVYDVDSAWLWEGVVGKKGSAHRQLIDADCATGYPYDELTCEWVIQAMDDPDGDCEDEAYPEEQV